MSVSIRNLTKRFGSVNAIDDLSIDFKPGAITVLLGASGCGKTTTLRCIAGLEQPTSGEIEIDGQRVHSSISGIDIAPEKRRLGMVFQSYAIWPHLSVLENVSLPLQAQKADPKTIEPRARETLANVGLSQQADRSAMQLSGGQQQRVSIARCIVADPKLILMDEPLSNLDAKLRVEMRQEIRTLQRRIGATILFVTHDQEEAMSLADEIFLFQNGKVVQRGAPEELYFRPAVRYVAEFLGKANLFPVTLHPAENGNEVRSEVSGQSLCAGAITASPAVNRANAQTATNLRADAATLGGKALCMVRPEAWRIGAEAGEGVRGRVMETMFVGDRRELRVETPFGLQTVVTPGFDRLHEGEAVTLTVAPHRMHLIAEAA